MVRCEMFMCFIVENEFFQTYAIFEDFKTISVEPVTRVVTEGGGNSYRGPGIHVPVTIQREDP